ncbi:hypothetical protein BDZ85DRAFT_259064 [Elsinoe ampelina]|uniref:Uncharacterized protein n=1 Tax=Elsinoe ampelina TaxID=302913 RepID=A0A6A6GGD7_9PEZI|nr:hypothetical protein BDZ85DRAFT_259064 [Elsinoe ampelina]
MTGYDDPTMIQRVSTDPSHLRLSSGGAVGQDNCEIRDRHKCLSAEPVAMYSHRLLDDYREVTKMKASRRTVARNNVQSLGCRVKAELRRGGDLGHALANHCPVGNKSSCVSVLFPRRRSRKPPTRRSGRAIVAAIFHATLSPFGSAALHAWRASVVPRATNADVSQLALL